MSAREPRDFSPRYRGLRHTQRWPDGATVRGCTIVEWLDAEPTIYRVRCACGVVFRARAAALADDAAAPLRHARGCAGAPA